jgi:glycosyltransferase involved in cell wall biosynthesis
LPKAIQCFLEQTYENRELLIVADGEDVRDLVPNDERIRLVHIEEGRRIGDKRNFGAALARGEIIAHWDDDDWSGPGRLADQVDRMVQAEKAVTGYHSMRFTDGIKSWLYSGGDQYAVGTSLCYRKDFWEKNPFPAKQVGEDGDFVRVARQQKQLVTTPAGELMFASIHPGNSSPRQLTGSQWVLL